MGENIDESPASADAQPIGAPGRRSKVTDDELAVLLEKAGGFKSRVAKQLGVTVSAICKRVSRSEKLREACRNVEETILDIAESRLIAAAEKGEPWAICFILKCKGRKRGWIERQDFGFAAGEDLPPPFVLGTIEIEEAKQPGNGGEGTQGEVMDAEIVEVPESAETPPQTEKAQSTAKSEAPEAPSAAKPPQCAPGAPVSRPEAPEGASNAPRPGAQQEATVRRPRTPSEAAAAMRKAEPERKATAQPKSSPHFFGGVAHRQSQIW